MAKVLIKKLDPAVELPAYKTEGASGMDLMALVKEPINLKPNSSCLVPTGLAVAFSSDFEIQIRPRSGLAAKNSISNKDRIAQMILTPVIKMDLEETDDLPETIRGEGGFGSTGK